MIPEAINTLTRWWLHRRFRSYRNYSAKSTGVLLVDVQRGLIPDSSRLLSPLAELVAFARRAGFSIVFSSFDVKAERKFETPAHRLLRNALRSVDDGDSIAEGLSPRPEDLVTAERPALSAFHGTGLHEQLQERGLEHLIIAGPSIRITLDSTIRDAVQLGYHVTLIPETLCEEIDEDSEYIRETLARYAQSILSYSNFQSLAEKARG